MYISDKGNGLREVYMNGFVRRQILIVGIRDLYGAVLYTGRTTRAFVFYNVSGLFIQGDLKISCFPFYVAYFSIRQDLDVRMPADLDQFG